MKKQNILWSIILVLILVFSTGVAIYGNKITEEDENELLKSKVKEEINYLDSKILGMLNSLNNINLQNYDVKSEEINIQSSESQENSSSGEKSKSTEKSGETSSGAGSEGGSSGQTVEDKQPKTTTKMEYNNIIGEERNPNWDNLKNNIENLHSSWGVIVLDLYKLNIDKAKILNFSNLLDTLTINIKEENKQNTLDTLTNMYSSIVGYTNDFSNDDILKKILTVKENIFYAYAKVDIKDWNEIETRLGQAEIAYVDILNNISNEQKEFNLNKGYILLKELQSSITEQDEDLFYIKYKNLIEELNLIKG